RRCACATALLVQEEPHESCALHRMEDLPHHRRGGTTETGAGRSPAEDRGRGSVPLRRGDLRTVRCEHGASCSPMLASIFEQFDASMGEQLAPSYTLGHENAGWIEELG